MILNLEKIENITGLVERQLARLLLRSVADEDLGNAIVDARKSSCDFVLGLFVDLSDFCEKMSETLDKMLFPDKEYRKDLKNVLVQIRDADCKFLMRLIRSRPSLVTIANETRENVKIVTAFPYIFRTPFRKTRISKR